MAKKKIDETTDEWEKWGKWDKISEEQRAFGSNSVIENSKEYSKYHYYSLFGFMALVVSTASLFIEHKVSVYLLFFLLFIFFLLSVSVYYYLLGCKSGAEAAIQNVTGWSYHDVRDKENKDKAHKKRDEIDEKTKSLNQKSNKLLIVAFFLYVVIIALFLFISYNHNMIENKDNNYNLVNMDDASGKTLSTPSASFESVKESPPSTPISQQKDTDKNE